MAWRVKLALPLAGLALAAVLAACGGGDGGGSPAAGETPRGEGPSGKLAFVAFRDGNQEIYSSNTDGSNQRNLTDDPAEDFDPDWSPDGERIAFVSNRSGQTHIYTMRADGSDLQQVTSDAVGGLSPRWSRDGRRIAYNSAGDVAIINVDGTGKEVVMESTQESSAEPCRAGSFPGNWSPDDDRITYYSASVSREVGQVCIVSAEGSEVEVVVEGDAYYVEPVFSPNGRYIAYRAIVEGQHDIWIADLETGERTNVTDDPDLDIEPSWSPDGEWIAFGSLRPDAPNFDLFIARPDGSELRRVTNHPTKEANPVWGP